MSRADWNRSSALFSRQCETSRSSGGRDVAPGLDERGRILLQDRAHHVGRRVAAERPVPREQLVEHRAEREDVGAGVGVLPADLLGRHVADGAEHGSGLRAARLGRRLGHRRRRLGPRELGEAEVEDLDAAVVRDEDVLGLQVAVDDALLVRGAEAARDLQGVVDGLARRDRAGGELLAQRRSLEQLRDDVRRALVGADVVDRHDVRMVEASCRARFLLEPAQPVGVRGVGGGQHLDRDLAIQPRVVRAVDLAHAPRPDGRDDVVRAKTGSGIDAHGSGRGYTKGMVAFGR